MLPQFNGFTQDTRLLQLSTPLGPDKLLAECMRCEEGLSQPYEIKLTALSTDAAIKLSSLIGQPALLELLTAERNVVRPFHGHIIGAECLSADGALARYSLTIGPWYAFLAHGRDSRVFQDMTVFDILDTLFGGWISVGQLVPSWRFDIHDRSVYPTRSLTCQYQESNLAFAERLMAEEGLFYFFEHAGDRDGAGLGSHTMVIADHNGAFKPNTQSAILFTQPGAVMKHDSMDRWRFTLSQRTNAIELSSWDYRTLGTRPVSRGGGGGDGDSMLAIDDVPGAYAYATREHGERIAERQLQALDAARERHTGAGTVRTLAPGTTFALHGQAQLDAAASDDDRSFIVVRVVHLAHNNLSAAGQATVERTLGPGALQAAILNETASSMHAVGPGKGERPLYRNRIDAIPSKTPYRSSIVDGHGQLLRPRPTVRGQQTAIVVGPEGAVIHTDRDHRIKVQFHWQRGGSSHSRLNHPVPEGHTGAPGNDQSGTWVRVATPMAPIAGANWGSVAIPRVGSEVLVDFLNGDIDRPVVIGSLYNGAGAPNAQGNQVPRGAGAATGNAPPWFPGSAGGHAHAAVLSGFKSQAMSSSQSGTGAYSQLVFDDSAGRPRLALQRHASPHTGAAELNLGHLCHQSDNQLLAPAGFGAELKTEHGAALRAGMGMLLSADPRANASGSQMDAREAQEQIVQSEALAAALANTAQKHGASLKDGKGNAEPEAGKLPAIAAMKHASEVLGARAAGDGARGNFGGGAGEATAFSEPQLQLSSPAGIAAMSPCSVIFTAGNTGSVSAGQDINFASQANFHSLVKAGISLFTYGKASSPKKPNQETGIKLHAASGKFSSQSQSDETKITADKTITVASVAKSVSVSAKRHVLLTAQGAFLKLEGGNIMLHGPGKIEFKATMKELAGPQRSGADRSLNLDRIKGCEKLASDASASQAGIQRI